LNGGNLCCTLKRLRGRPTALLLLSTFLGKQGTGPAMLNEFTNCHMLLVSGADFEVCRRKVENFFEKNELVRYDRVTVIDAECFPAEQEEFWTRLRGAIEANRQETSELTRFLVEEGYGDIGQWHTMPQGYVSKTVHILAHLLDGFFGVDSNFYNLIDDSHWLRSTLERQISADPSQYWLIQVEGSSLGQDPDRLAQLRR
jgi:hypothetical protein